jgi:PAS domain S-box-containing protein
MSTTKPTSRASRNATALSGRSDFRGLLAEIVQSSADAIFSRRLDGIITSWNRASERIFGYQPEEVIGKHSSLLLPPDRPDETDRLLTKIRHGERVEHFETLRLRNDGKRLTVSLTLSPIRSRAGRIIGASTIARDVTTQRELEAQLLEITERERRQLGRDLHDGLGQHLSGMELICRALARSLSRRSPPDAITAELLVAQIQSATQQTRALARGLAPVMESADGLMLALQDFSAVNRTLFRVNCTFECEEPVLIPDHTAAVHLFRIAQEAVANALRHGRARRVRILLRRKLERLTLEVHDNGRGFPAVPARGAGMGLRIMSYRAAALGGSLRLSSAVPRGTVVACSVPTDQLNIHPPLTR